MAIEQSEERERGHSGSTIREKKSPLCYNDGHLSSQKMELEPKFHKCKSRLALRRDIVKDGQAADEASAYTQVKLEDAPR